MLVFSGLGSFFSRKFVAGDDSVSAERSSLLPYWSRFLRLLLPAVSNAGIVWPLSLRMLVTAAMIAPAAFAMGMPFPSGLIRLEKFHPASVRWAWALNAASSVFSVPPAPSFLRSTWG